MNNIKLLLNNVPLEKGGEVGGGEVGGGGGGGGAVCDKS